MRGLACAVRLSVMLVALSWLAGCAAPGPSAHPAWEPVPIQEFGNVAGKLEGLMTRLPRATEDDWVRVMIHPDGAYEFASYRTIGVFTGKGTLELTDGTVKATSERGVATLGLYQADDRRLLRVVGVTKDGLKYEADLAPAR